MPRGQGARRRYFMTVAGSPRIKNKWIPNILEAKSSSNFANFLELTSDPESGSIAAGQSGLQLSSGRRTRLDKLTESRGRAESVVSAHGGGTGPILVELQAE